MTNEEFQKLVLEKLDKLDERMGTLEEGQRNLEERQGRLEEGQRKLEERQKSLEEGQRKLEERQKSLEEGQRKLEERQGKLEEGQRKLEDRLGKLEEGYNKLELGQEQIIKELKGVVEQTADLLEFRYEVKQELADIKANISRIEIATADNWSDIARLKAIRQI